MDKIIGVDIDGVLANTASRVLSIVNKQQGSSYTESDWTTYHSKDCFPAGVSGLVYEVAHDPVTYATLEPIDGSIPALTHLSRCAAIWFLTSRPKNCQDVTKDWLKRYCTFPYEVYFASAKHRWCAAYGLDAMIEDCLETAVKCAESARLSIIFDAPWNREHSRGVIRCKGWTDVLAVILERL